MEIIKQANFWDGKPIKTGFVRHSYLQQVTKYLDNQLVKVILGQRRVGKSYILRMLIEHLITERQVPPENIFYINKDIHSLDFIDSSTKLLEVVKQYQTALLPSGKIYIFLDEVQEIANWEKAVNSLSQDYTQDFEVFITGSNAKLLSTELSTYLSGRYINFEIFPFSYEEFLDFNKRANNKESFFQYLKFGGMPESYALEDLEIKKNYFTSLHDSIVLRDIVQRHKVRDVYLLEKLICFLIDSTGSYFSINSVVNFLKSSGYKTNSETIGSYIRFLINAYFLHESERYDIQGKRILGGERKFYLNDLGFKFFLSSSFDFGVGKFLENAVYLHLRRKGYSVYTGRIKGKEIDFIAEKNGMKMYLQVAYLLPDEKVIEREFGNLTFIPDNYPKQVITLDDVHLGNRNGITHVNAWDFFVDKNH